MGGLFGILFALPFAAPLEVAANDILPLALLACLVMPLSFALINTGPRYLPAPEVSLLFLLEMVLGPLWVWLAIGEAPSEATLIGGAVLLAVLSAHAWLGLRDDRARRHTG